MFLTIFHFKRNYVIFDQLNLSFAKYFTKFEIMELLSQQNFKIIELKRRHNYSYTAICEKKVD